MATVLLLLPAGTYRATDFVGAARSLEIEVVVVTNAASPVAPPTDDTDPPEGPVGSFMDRVITVDFSVPGEAADSIVATMDERGGRGDVAAVVAADDSGVLTAALTRELLGLPGNPPEAVILTRDKAAMRQCLASAGVSQPEFVVINPGSTIAAALSVGFPCVVKPAGLSGSRGVIRVDDPESLSAAAGRARVVASEAGEPDTLLVVERYIDGAEVAVEGLIDDGVFTTLAVFDKPGASSGPYFEETYYVTPSQLPTDTLVDVDRTVASAAAALGLVDGPVHAEARIDAEGRVWILELAARSIGGLCSRSLRFGLGISLEALILRHALHMPVSDLTRESASSGVLMLPIPAEGVLEAVDGQNAARSVFGIQGLEITIPLGRAVRPLPDGDRYLGFMFARGPSPEAVESTLRDAFAKLKIVINP